MNENSDEAKCPLCGQNNACHNIVNGASRTKPCWCENTEYEFPVDLFTHIPAKFKDKACICEACAQAYRKKYVRRQ